MITDHAANINDEQGQFDQRNNCKLASAKEYLGSHWVLHPAYRPIENMHHSVHNKNAACLTRVADRAKWCGRVP